MKKTLFHFFLLGIVFSMFSCNDGSNSAGSSAETSTPATDWKLGVQLWTFHKFDFVTAIAKADSAGIKYIEAFPGQKLGGDFKDSIFDIDLSEEAQAKVKELLQSKGMLLTAFGVVVPDTREKWLKTFAFAKSMGIQYITAEPLPEHWDLADSLAGAYGIKVAIHDHPKPSHYWHPDSVLAAVKNHPNLGSCADIGHWGRNGLNPAQCLKQLEGHLIGLHFKDITELNKVDAGDEITGTGALDMPAIFSELKRQKFKGQFSIEREENWDNNVPDVKATVKYFEGQLK